MKKILLLAFAIGGTYLIFKSESYLKIAFGLSLFLYAMKIMEESFQILAGGRLETFLRKTTDKNYKSFTFGLISTSIMQSSGLVSLLAISFVSAGLIGLGAGIGIIYGSNLGTTTGIWLIAEIGFGFNIAKFAMPFIIFGVFMAFSKVKAVRGSGLLILSIGMIFFGISYMKEGFESVKDAIDLAKYGMSGYAGAAIFAIIGVVVTALLQSSHATLTLTLSALATAQISYENAIALAIGSNVGSTITAVLGSINASINGKKLMIAHAIFNIATALISLIFMFQFISMLNIVAEYLHIKDDDYLLKLALFHTFFNLLGVAIFYPNIGLMEKFLNEKINIKVKKEHTATPNYLTPDILGSAEAAKVALINESMHLLRNTLSVVTKGLYLSYSDITSELNPVEVIKKRSEINEINFDKLYITRFKSLYNEIVSFSMKFQNLNENDTKIFNGIRRTAVECAEILKDMRNIEPNFFKYLQSDNEYICGEYNNFRLQMLILLRMVFAIKDAREIFGISKALREELRKFDILSGRKIDQLLTQNKITSSMATSLMNDSYLLQDIVRNLYKIMKNTAIYGRENSLDLTIFGVAK